MLQDSMSDDENDGSRYMSEDTSTDNVTDDKRNFIKQK